MIFGNAVNIEIAMRSDGVQVSLDVDEETSDNKYSWEFGKEPTGGKYIVIGGDKGQVFISEKLCKMISAFLECEGNYELLDNKIREYQEMASMFSPGYNYPKQQKGALVPPRS